jgi:hypothetical protein
MAKQPEKTGALQRLASEFGLKEAFFFAGLALLTIGAAQVYAPAGWLVPGSVLTWLGVRG